MRAGHVSAEEAAAMTVPTYLRTNDEIEAPLRDGAADLVLLEHQRALAPDPAFRSYAEHGDRTRFAADAVTQLRAWAQPSLEAGLSTDRSAAARAAASNGLFTAIGARLAADPERGHCDWVISALAIAKQG